MKLVVSAAIVLPLVACANPSLEKLRHTPPKGTVFQNQLAKFYLTYAEVEQKQGNYQSSSIFAEKGLQAAYGNDVLPSEPTLADIDDPEILSQFAEHHFHVVDLLNDKTKRANPIAAAGAVFFYDCMLDQQQYAPRSEEGLYCSEQWQQAMGDLREARSGLIASESLSDVTSAAVAPVERYLVYFALDDYSLNDAAERTVQLLYEELTKQTGAKQLTISVNGHTDTTGSDRYNMMLSNRRADTVKKMLVVLGMQSEAIEAYGFGETDLKTPTADEVLEPKNRRVEIVVN